MDMLEPVPEACLAHVAELQDENALLMAAIAHLQRDKQHVSEGTSRILRELAMEIEELRATEAALRVCDVCWRW